MKVPFALLGVAGVATASSKGLRLTFYSGEYCSGDKAGLASVGKPETLLAQGICGVNASPSETVLSVRVKGLEDDSKSWRYSEQRSRVLRFYSSDSCETSCTQSNIIEETSWNGCVDLSYDVAAGRSLKSFNIVEEGQTGRGFDTLDRAFCFLSHGDEVTARGRRWKMQQVAAGLFREVAVEDWDDAVHERNTTRRFAVHGDVDARGSRKFWQDGPGSLDWVGVEEWDEKVHQKVTDPWQRELERYKWRVEDICDEVPDDKIEADGFVTISDDIRISCGQYRMNEYGLGGYDYSQSVFMDWEL